MRMRLTSLTAVALCVGPGPASAQEVTEVLGIVRNTGAAHLYYERTPEGWRHTRWTSGTSAWSEEEPWVGVAVTFADTLGGLHRGEMGSARPGESMEVIYQLPEARDHRNTETWYRLAIGYATTLADGHAPFSQVEPDVMSEPWNRFISELEQSNDAIPFEVKASLWHAVLGERSVTYFQVSRRADVERGCPPLEYYSGVILEGTSGPVVATHSSGDCEGKGASSREPVGLVEISERAYVLVSTYGWEDDGAELWEVDIEGLQAVRFLN